MAKENTQQTLVNLTGLSKQRISQLQRAGVFVRGEHPLLSNRKIIKHLGEQAAGRQGSEPSEFDLVRERARLAARQSERAEIENALRRAELLPLIFVKDYLSFQNSTLRSRYLGTPNELKAKHPELSTPILLSLKAIVTGVLTELGYVRFPADMDERIKRYFQDLQSAAKSDGNGVGG